MVLGNLQKFYELRIGTTERKVKIIRAVSVTVWTSLLRKVIFILYSTSRSENGKKKTQVYPVLVV